MKDDFDVSLLKKTKSKKINSKAKGGRFERKVAEMLNKKFETSEFCRTPGSGAFATTHKLPDHLKLYGDLITPKEFKFVIECKSGYNKESIYSVLDTNSILCKMIAQAERDSKKISKYFLLIVGQDRREPVVITDYKFPISCNHATLNINGVSYYMLSLKDLLEQHNCYFI